MYEKIYLIYALVDPRTKEIRYIGKSSNGLLRPKEHMTPSSLKNNTHKNNWIKSLSRLGLEPDIVILEYSCCNEENIIKEREYITKYINFGFELTNCTSGGEGGTKTRSIALIATNIKTGEIKEYCSIHSTLQDGFSPTKVCAVCKGRKKHHKGWFFCYKHNPKQYIKVNHNSKQVVIINKHSQEKIIFNSIIEASEKMRYAVKTLRTYCSDGLENDKYIFKYGESVETPNMCPYCGDNDKNCHCFSINDNKSYSYQI